MVTPTFESASRRLENRRYEALACALCHSSFRCRQMCVLMAAKQEPLPDGARAQARGHAVFAEVDWAAPIESQKSKR